MRRPAIWFAILSLSGAALACNLPPGVPITPTLIPTLPHPTAVVLAPTSTPTPFLSATLTFTLTPTHTLTPSATFTPTHTNTATPSFTPTTTPTATNTVTPSPTNTPTAVPTETDTWTPTYTLTPTFTGIPSNTPTETPRPTLTPSYTLPPPTNTPAPPTSTPTQAPTITPTPLPTSTPTALPTDTPVPPSDTSAPTLTALPSSTDTPIVPTDTAAPTITAVPQPSLTANVAATAPDGTPTPLPPLPTNRPTNTSPSVIVLSTSVGPGGGNGNSGGVGSGRGNGTPGAGAVGGLFGTVTAIAGTTQPTAAFLFYAGGNGGGSIYRSGDGLVTTLLPGQTYVVNPATGASASVDANGALFINSQLYTLSPSSRYGTGQKFRVTLLKWSPDGRFLAFRVETPNAQSGTLSFNDTINDGIWIYEPAANKSWQTFRNLYRAGQTIQIAYDFSWTNDSRTLLVWVGWGYVLVDSSVDINHPGK